MSLAVAYTSGLTVTEVLADADLNASGRTLTHSANSTSGSFNSASTPPVTTRARMNYTMVSGSGSIDLRALIGSNGAAVDGNGLRAQFVKLTALGTNANAITISKGVSSGYDGLGAAFSISLMPGAELLVRLVDGGSDIGSSNKTLDLAGIGSQGIVGEIVMG